MVVGRLAYLRSGKRYLTTTKNSPSTLNQDKSAWQFLYKTNDPRLSMLRKFAEAAGVSVKSLV